MSDGCLFCRIVAGEIPATEVYRTPTLVAVRDIGPQAPTHVLVIPRRHIDSLNAAEDGALLGELLLAGREVARMERIDGRGYRLVINTNGTTLNGFVLTSKEGLLTGDSANNLGLFQVDNDQEISGQMFFALTGKKVLGKVVGEGISATQLA